MKPGFGIASLGTAGRVSLHGHHSVSGFDHLGGFDTKLRV